MINPYVKIGTVTAEENTEKSISLPVGGTHRRLFLRMRNGATAATTAQVLAALTSIRIDASHKVNGAMILQNDSGTDFLYMIEQYYGEERLVSNDSGLLTIDPAAVWARDEYHRRTTCIGTADLDSLDITFKFGAIDNLSQVEVWSDYNKAQKDPIGVHRVVGRATVTIPASTGKFEITELPKFDASCGYAALHFQVPAGVEFDNLTITRNTDVIDYNQVPKDIIDRDLSLNNRSAQDGWVHVDFAKEDTPQFFLGCGMQEFKVEPNVKTAPAAATQMKVYYEVIKQG